MEAQESFCISPEVIIGFRALMSNFCFTNFNVFTHRIQWEESFEAFLFIGAQIKSRTNICWLLVTQTYRTFKDKQSKEPSIDATRVVSGELCTCLNGSRRRRRLCVRCCPALHSVWVLCVDGCCCTIQLTFAARTALLVESVELLSTLPSLHISLEGHVARGRAPSPCRHDHSWRLGEAPA